MKINNPIKLNNPNLEIPIRNNKELVYWRNRIIKIYPKTLMTESVKRGELNPCTLLHSNIYLCKYKYPPEFSSILHIKSL